MDKTGIWTPFLRVLPVAVGLAALFFATAWRGTQGFWVVFLIQLGLVALWLLLRVFRAANAWTERWDFFAPGVAFVLVYLGWFSLGSANIFSVSGNLMNGAFAPVPAYLWAYYLLGLAGYLAGVWLGGGYFMTDSRKLSFRGDWDLSNFWNLATLLTVLMTVCYAAQSYQYGIPVLSHLAGEERTAIRGIPHFLFVSAAYALVAVVPAFLWTRHATHRSKVVGVSLVVLAVALLLSQGGRADPTEALLVAFFVFHYVKRKRTLGSCVKLGVVAIVLLSLTGFLRDYLLSGAQKMGWISDLGVPRWAVPFFYVLFYVRYTVATFRDVVQTIPSLVTFQHGALFVMPFGAFLPGHHETSDMFFKRILGSHFVGMGQPATILGPLYGDFGAVGIFAGMLLFGLIAAKAYRAMLRKRTPLSAILYAWVLLSGIFGMFAGFFVYITTLTMPLLLVAFSMAARRMSAARHRAPRPLNIAHNPAEG